MVKNAGEIHILCEELLPFYEELGDEAKAIINRHMEECSSCRQRSQQLQEFNLMLQNDTKEEETAVVQTYRKFSKLHKVKNLVIFAIILFKAVIVTLIGKEFMVLATTTEAPLGLLDEGVRASMLIFYMPLAIIALVLSNFFVKKRTAIMIFILDILLFIYLDDILVKWVSS